MKRLLRAIREWVARDLIADLRQQVRFTDGALRLVERQRNEHATTSARLRAGLVNIHAHAIRGPVMPFVPEALRDYCREVLDNPLAQTRQHNTEGVSAAQRWGYDFTEAPGDKTPPPRIRRN